MISDNWQLVCSKWVSEWSYDALWTNKTIFSFYGIKNHIRDDNDWIKMADMKALYDIILVINLIYEMFPIRYKQTPNMCYSNNTNISSFVPLLFLLWCVCWIIICINRSSRLWRCGWRGENIELDWVSSDVTWVFPISLLSFQDALMMLLRLSRDTKYLNRSENRFCIGSASEQIYICDSSSLLRDKPVSCLHSLTL